MGKKAIISSVFVFAVVGAIIGAAVIGGSKSKNASDDGSGETSTGGLSSSMKAITAICAPTDYKEQCTETLGSIVAANASAGPKDFFKGSVEATVKYVTGAFNLSDNLAKGTTDTSKLASLSNCKELLQYAIDELQDAIGTVSANENPSASFDEKADDIKNWLSAVLSYQDTCVDQIDDPEMKSAMQNGVLNATQLTSNALAIVSQISSLLGTFKLPFSSNSRRLMSSEENDVSDQLGSNGYPKWMAVGERKLLAANAMQKPNAVVAKDGSGQFKSINAALNAMPANYRGRYVIYVKAGIYNEYVEVTKKMVNVFMYGDGPRRTIVTGNKSNKAGYKTMNSASFAAIGDGFIAKSMGFRNTAGPEGHQAVAIRVQSDRSAFYNCRFDGYQDTLYAQTHRQFYRNCVVSGTVDFIFGDSAVILQNCRIIVRRPMDNQQNTITAHGRTDKRETTGIVIHNCKIVPEQKLYPVRFKLPTYLGRPWKEYSRTIIMESVMGDFIQPAGWMPWDGEFALNTLVYAEYANTGPGARTTRRVRWPGYKIIKTRREAIQYTVGPFIQGNQWLAATGAPFLLGLRR